MPQHTSVGTSLIRTLRGGLALALALAAGPLAAQQSQLVIRGLDFKGNKSVPTASLAASISTTASSFFARNSFVRWIGLGEKRFLNEVEFQRDVLRLQVLYRRSGFPDVQVDTLVKRSAQDVFITFRIEEGTPIRVTQFTVTGLEALAAKEREAVLSDLPLREGRPLNLSLLQASVDSVVTRLRSRGYPRADAFRDYSADSAARAATAAIDVVPGPRMSIGTIRVEGNEKVDSGVVRALLATSTGRRFSERELFTSQANLYRSDLFRLAAVGLDSAAFQPGDSVVPLVVRVAEARTYRVRGSAGYATQDCFRVSGGVARRNFLGRGRVLDVSGRVSKIGVGEPADFGLESGFLCQALEEDSIGSSKLNYNLTASVRRPAFLTPQTSITVSAFSERRSEFAIYLREDIGSSLALTRESQVYRDPITLSYTFSYGKTSATPAVFCSFFNACTEELRSLQEQRQPLAILGLRASRSRVNNPVEPSRGTVLLGETAWSSTLIGSSEFQQFTRLVGEGRWYGQLRRDWVLALRARGGMVFGGGLTEYDVPTFVPVDQRFYAGGPNDVRGYAFNTLGPVVYVADSAELADAGSPAALEDQPRAYATGGNTLVVGNVELRLPSPILGSTFRFAAFVDVGSVWQRGEENSAINFRVTPGVGVRLQTPVGPFRLDLAYNPYKLQGGTLYESRPNGDLVEVTDEAGDVVTFQPTKTEGWRLNITVGQPF
ncbi:MAG TPA: BamA/TamA family outer membrane protein [Gemmatimonadales bacterium]|nr:BamA/TamA family outer membrane protein [Gemmatimonadales bacterium]